MNPNQLKSRIYDLATSLTDEYHLTHEVEKMTNNQEVINIAVDLMYIYMTIRHEAEQIIDLMYASPTSWTECEIALADLEKHGQKERKRAYQDISKALKN